MDRTVEEELASIRRELELSRQREEQVEHKENTPDSSRRGSRFVGPNADASLVEHIASGGSLRVAEPRTKALGATTHTGKSALVSHMKALAEGTGSSGGYLVPVEVALEVAELLRARSAVMQLGPTEISVEKELDLVSLSTGSTAYWVSENANIPISEETFASAPKLLPKQLAALVPISNRLLSDADNPSVEEVVKRDLSEVLALRMDLAFLRGTGTGGEPTGLRNQAGLTPAPSLGANGAIPSFQDLKRMVGALRNANAPFAKPGWIFAPSLLGTLERITTTDGHFLGEMDNLLSMDPQGGGGKLLGYPFQTTSQIPVNLVVGTSSDTTEVYFSSDWNEFWVGTNTELTLETSREASYETGGVWVSSFQANQSLFRAIVIRDAAPRRSALFSVMVGARVTT